MSSLDSLPAATPYPWGLNDYQIFESKGRKRKGTGIAFLQFTLQNGKVSKGAAKILTELLPDLADKTANDFCPNMSTALLEKYIPTPIHSAQPEDGKCSAKDRVLRHLPPGRNWHGWINGGL